MSDWVFTVAFALSLGVHLILLSGQLFQIEWLRAPRLRQPPDIVYDTDVAQQDLRDLQERLARAKSETAASPAPPSLSERAHIRIPERPSLSAGQALTPITPDRSSSVVDLTNLVDAARGDPVLLTYFSALREQIQQTANRQSWLSGDAASGLVYVAFELASNGAVKSVKVVSERSALSQTLQDVALRIVKISAPFPPFPPSMIEPSKTVVVPLEFLLDSS
ncbi:MAG: TonB family protein [Candidatus Omnitrophica bacterium]|nr:TonB family protein [Candidatus Omnitrophota bacterium]